MKKEETEAATSKDANLINNEKGGGSLKVCDNDLGCGEPDVSGGWRQEYRHQMVVAAVPHPGV